MDSPRSDSDGCSVTSSVSGSSPAGSIDTVPTPFSIHQLDDRLCEVFSEQSRRPNTSVKSICCVGAGYVGGPTAAVIAYHNPDIQVSVVDLDPKRIRKWNSSHLPVHEPGLKEVVRLARDGILGRNGQDERKRNLTFSTDVSRFLSDADIILLSVNTSTKVNGLGAGRATDMSAVESATRSIALAAKPGAIIVEKSTVPVRTSDLVRRTLALYRPHVSFEVLSNPEFLAEGTAIPDLMEPDRILIGSATTPSGMVAAETLASVYGAWVPRSRIYTTNLYSSELAKLAANAILAQRLSSINTLSAVCEATGADVTEVARVVGMDRRIGGQFLGAGVGFGGSCFKKDILNLIYIAESLHLPEVAAYWEQVLKVNDWQQRRFAEHIVKRLNGSLRRKKITILGYAFKPDTNDTRETPAVEIIRNLLSEGPREIAIFDPGCNVLDMKLELAAYFGDRAECLVAYEDPYAACEGADALAIVTAWDQFRYAPAAKPASKRPPLYRNLQSAPSRLELSFRPDLSCAEDCTDCLQGLVSPRSASKADLDKPLDYRRIAAAMQTPKWVFDGRAVLEGNGLEALGVGFIVESIGVGRQE